MPACALWGRNGRHGEPNPAQPGHATVLSAPDGGEAMQLSDVPGIEPAHRDALAAATVESAEALAAAEDVADLAARSGIDAETLERYRTLAREALARATPDAPAPDQVVLLDRAPIARVRVAGQVHEAVPIVTAWSRESDDEVLARAGGDAVILREKAETAPARLGGATYPALPLYKERLREGSAPEEVRVRVHEIREVAEKKPLFGRLFGKKA